MDDYIWKMRGASFLRSLKVAVEELQRNTCILKNETAMKRDAVDPSSASLKKCFEPIHDSLWSYCQHGVDPRVLERIFGSKPEPQEVKAYRVAHTRYLDSIWGQTPIRVQDGLPCFHIRTVSRPTWLIDSSF